MKYGDSYIHVETITATSQTTYSKWIDVSFANELYSWLTFEETGTANSEKVDVTLERFVGYVTSTATTVLTHTQIAAAGNEEKIAYAPATDGAAPGAENTIGNRVRWKFVSSGTFGSGNSITMTMRLDMKRN